MVTAQDLRAQQPAGRYDPSTYVHTTEATRENSDFEFDRYDTYEWYLNVGQLSNIQTRILKDRTLPTRTRFRRASELRSLVAASGDAPVSHAPSRCRRSTWPAGGIRKTSTVRSRSIENPVPLVPNVGTPFTIDLHTQSYRFQKGHRIMVQVQSTWFPIIDRNPSRRDGGSPVVISARRIGFHLGTRSLTVLLAGPLPKGFDETRLS